MRIAIDARMINSSTGRYVERLLHYLERIDTVNEYQVLVRAADRDYWQPSNPRFTVVVADFKYYSLSEQLGYRSFLERLAPDLVHFTMPQQPVLYHGPHVTTIHDLTLLNTYNSDKNWLAYHAKQFVGRFVFKRVARTSEIVLTPSEFTKRAVVDSLKADPAKVRVTYESADTILEPSKPVSVVTDRFLLYVGQQSDYKNIRRLIEAHQSLLADHPDLQLILAGSLNASARNNQDWVRERGYQQVIFTGFVTDGQLRWLYENAACYVFPSLMEGFGLPGLEAMRAGCPVASSDATCLPEIYADAALYFDPRDIGAIALTVGKIIDNQSTRDRLVELGHQRAVAFSWEDMARQTLAAYCAAAGLSDRENGQSGQA